MKRKTKPTEAPQSKATYSNETHTQVKQLDDAKLRPQDAIWEACENEHDVKILNELTRKINF